MYDEEERSYQIINELDYFVEFYRSNSLQVSSNLIYTNNKIIMSYDGNNLTFYYPGEISKTYQIANISFSYSDHLLKLIYPKHGMKMIIYYYLEGGQ